MAVSKSLSPRIMKKLKQLYGRKFGAKVPNSAEIAKMLKSGAKVPTYAKDGGYIAKKRSKRW
jgi:F0F1-type ATP synthase delta subunit